MIDFEFPVAVINLILATTILSMLIFSCYARRLLTKRICSWYFGVRVHTSE